MQKNKIKENKIFRQMNTFSDILFFVFICLTLFLFSSYYFQYKDEFVRLLKYFVLISGWTELIAGMISFVIEFSFVVGGFRLYTGRTFWIFFRSVFTFILLSGIYFLEKFLIGEFPLNL